MFVITVEFTIKPDRVNDFMPLMNKNAAASFKEEPGCHQFDVCLDPNDQTKVFLYEVYSNKAAFEAHKQTEHFKSFNADTADMIESKNVAALYRDFPK
ncbi:MAG: putative quinol monooxygenase [Rhodospirillales bacterium]|jgi:autoinducer 2-degrading protein